MQTLKIKFLIIIAAGFVASSAHAALADYIFFEPGDKAGAGLAWQPAGAEFQLQAPPQAVTQAIEVHVNINPSLSQLPQAIAEGPVYELSVMSDQEKFDQALEFLLPVESTPGLVWWLQQDSEWNLQWGFKDINGSLYAAFKLTQPGVYNLVLARDADKEIIVTSKADKSFATSLFSITLPNDITLGSVVKLQHLAAGNVPIPKGLVSPIYQYDLIGFSVADIASKLVSVTLPYYLSDYQGRDLVFFDKRLGEWRTVPSINNLQKQTVTGKLPFTYAVVALVENPNVFDGVASWYAYKACACAAARFWPKQSKLKVTNLANGLSKIVRLNDYGPEEWTGRLIDLDSTVFKAISSLWRGLINVRVEEV